MIGIELAGDRPGKEDGAAGGDRPDAERAIGPEARHCHNHGGEHASGDCCPVRPV